MIILAAGFIKVCKTDRRISLLGAFECNRVHLWSSYCVGLCVKIHGLNTLLGSVAAVVDTHRRVASRPPIRRRGRMFISWILTQYFDGSRLLLCRHSAALIKPDGGTGTGQNSLAEPRRNRELPEPRIEMKAFSALMRPSTGVCSRCVRRVVTPARGLSSQVVCLHAFIIRCLLNRWIHCVCVCVCVFVYSPLYSRWLSYPLFWGLSYIDLQIFTAQFSSFKEKLWCFFYPLFVIL